MQHALPLNHDNAAREWPRAAFDLPKEKFCGIALVGEAPGAEEARLGKPFVGRSGQLLDKILAAAAINRRACLVANVFGLQPPGNKVDHFFMSKRAAAEAGEALAEAYGAFSSKFCLARYGNEIESLKQALLAHKPTIIVALGRTPLWALTGENELLKKVGKTIPCKLLPGIPVLPTYHPSFILRGNWKLQSNWLDHMKLAESYAHK